MIEPPERTSYFALQEQARSLFLNAVLQGGYGKDKAFAFTSDRLRTELLAASLEHRITAFAALFMCALENHYQPDPKQTLSRILLEDMHKAFSDWERVLISAEIPDDEKRTLRRDIPRLLRAFPE